MAKFDLNKIHLYDWEDLYWYEEYVYVGFSAIRLLIENQEKAISENLIEQDKRKRIGLSNIPDEYKYSYEQQFFVHTDMALSELSFSQRNSVCLLIFSFVEGKLRELIEMIAEEFNLTFNIENQDLISEYWKALVNEYKMDKTKVEKFYTPFRNQRIIRNAITHNNSILTSQDIHNFKLEKGLKLEGKKVKIEDVEYLYKVLNLAEKFFKYLLISIDLKYQDLKA